MDPSTDTIKAFNAELAGLYECKPPISKAKMTSITKSAMRAIKFYKHVVQSVEKFIQKCKTEYKIPGLYVIDSIVRQSRHQFGIDKDQFAPRFGKNILVTFFYLFKCPQEDKSKVIRVLNLWQKNQVFVEEVIQPLFDLADPNHPIHREVGSQIMSKANQPKGNQGGPSSPGDGFTGPTTVSSVHQNMTPQQSNQNQVMAPSVDPNLMQHIQQILLKQPTMQEEMPRGGGPTSSHATPDRAPPPGHHGHIGQHTSAGDFDHRMMKDYDGRSLPFLQMDMSLPPPGFMSSGPPSHFTGLQVMHNQMSQPPPGMDYMHPPPGMAKSPREEGEHSDDSDDVKEIHPDEIMDERTVPSSHSRSPSRSHGKRRRSPTSPNQARSRRRRSRSRSRGRRSTSRSRRRRSRDRDRRGGRDREREKVDPVKEKEKELERENELERKKKGLPPIKKDHMSVCSTTLWVGHLSKLIIQEELSDTFGELGDIVSIDLIPPRGCAFICMNRRQDASRALNKLRDYKMHGKAITIAWAPGKGVKGKDFKDYWEVEVGCSYIPYSKLRTMNPMDLETLEEGGAIDEETIPDWLKGRFGTNVAPASAPMPTFMPMVLPPNHHAPPHGQVNHTMMPPMTSLPPPIDKNMVHHGPPKMFHQMPSLPPHITGNLPMMPPPSMTSMMPPHHFAMANMPPPGMGPRPLPPLPGGLVPQTMPSMGVPPPMGMPPMGMHPPVSSILGQPLIGAMPTVTMAPDLPSPTMMMPGGKMMLGASAVVNPPAPDNTDMDIDMEDAPKEAVTRGTPNHDHDKRSRFDHRRSPERDQGNRGGLVERLMSIASMGGASGDAHPPRDRDREFRGNRDRDRDRGYDRDRRGRGDDRDKDRGRGTDWEERNRGGGSRDARERDRDRFGFSKDEPSGFSGTANSSPAGLPNSAPNQGAAGFNALNLSLMPTANGVGFGPRGPQVAGGFDAPRALLGLAALMGVQSGMLHGPQPGLWLDGGRPRFPGPDSTFRVGREEPTGHQWDSESARDWHRDGERPRGERWGTDRPSWDENRSFPVDRRRDGERPSGRDTGGERFRDNFQRSWERGSRGDRDHFDREDLRGGDRRQLEREPPQERGVVTPLESERVGKSRWTDLEEPGSWDNWARDTEPTNLQSKPDLAKLTEVKGRKLEEIAEKVDTVPDKLITEETSTTAVLPAVDSILTTESQMLETESSGVVPVEFDIVVADVVAECKPCIAVVTTETQMSEYEPDITAVEPNLRQDAPYLEGTEPNMEAAECMEENEQILSEVETFAEEAAVERIESSFVCGSDDESQSLDTGEISLVEESTNVLVNTGASYQEGSVEKSPIELAQSEEVSPSEESAGWEELQSTPFEAVPFTCQSGHSETRDSQMDEQMDSEYFTRTEIPDMETSNNLSEIVEASDEQSESGHAWQDLPVVSTAYSAGGDITSPNGSPTSVPEDGDFLKDCQAWQGENTPSPESNSFPQGDEGEEPGLAVNGLPIGNQELVPLCHANEESDSMEIGEVTKIGVPMEESEIDD